MDHDAIYLDAEAWEEGIMLNLTCLLDVQVEMLSGQLESQVSQREIRMEIQIWEPSVYGYYLRP